jgi:hypothetical protein
MAYKPRPPIRAAQRSALNHLRSVVAPQTAPRPPQAPLAPPLSAQAYSYSDDPGLASTHALYDPQLGPSGSLAAAASAQSRQALIDYGYDPALTSLYGDAGTQGAAQANPYSTLQSLLRNHQQRQTNINEADNKANLSYSGHHNLNLANEQTQYGGEEYSAASALRNTLAGIQGSLLSQQNAGYGAIAGAEQTAYGNTLNFALQNQQFPPPQAAARSSGTAVRRVLSAAARRRLR